MVSTRSLHPPRRVALLGWAILLSFAATVHADPKPLPKEEQAKVDKAIDRAVAFLKSQQREEGAWPGPYLGYSVAQCALPAYALLEAGVPSNDAAIKRAATFLRSKILDTNQTYELSLGILFLDRLSDPKDKKLIQTCALRLIAGQHRAGGWTYLCPKLKADDEEPFLKSLGELAKVYEAGKKPTGNTFERFRVPSALQQLTVFQDRRSIGEWFQLETRRLGEWSKAPEISGNHLIVIQTDNSNTHFAMLALWAAQRRGLPLLPTFDIIYERFVRTQRVDGSWPYTMSYKGSTPSMICVGLMGLAIGRGLNLPSAGHPSSKRADPQVVKGLAALYKQLGIPTVLNSDFYFLWSMERVGMLYDLPTLGDKEWYRWGAQILVLTQKEKGGWVSVEPIVGPRELTVFVKHYGPALSTAFALLFLKHSHPMKDLTPKLPFTASELNRGIARVLRDPTMLERIQMLERIPAAPSRNTKP